MSVFPNVSFTHEVLVLTVFSVCIPQSPNIPAPVFSTTLHMKRRSSFVSPPSWDLVVRQIQFEMSVDLQSSSTPVRAIGTSLETTFPSSSFKMQSNSLTSFTLENPSPRLKFLRVNPLTIISGISPDSLRRPPICKCGSCLIGLHPNIPT